MEWFQQSLQHLAEAALFAVLGLILFAAAMKLMVKISPFSIRKEIEEDQNVALGVVVGSVFIGLALILAAAMHG